MSRYGKVTKSIHEWARIRHVAPLVYYDVAKRLGYPVTSLTSPVPKHWHDDIKTHLG